VEWYISRMALEKEAAGLATATATAMAASDAGRADEQTDAAVLGSFGQLNGARTSLLEPLDFTVAYAGTASRLLGLDAPQAYVVGSAMPARAADTAGANGARARSGSTRGGRLRVDPLRSVALRRPPRERSRLTVETHCKLSASFGYADFTLVSRLLQGWYDAGFGAAVVESSAGVEAPSGGPTHVTPGAVGAADTPGGTLAITHPLYRGPEPPLQAAALPLLRRGVFSVPSHWHPDDYEVVFPDGLQMGLELRQEAHSLPGADASAAGADPGASGIVTTVVIHRKPAQTAGSAPVATAPTPLLRYDLGSGLVAEARSPADACGAIQDGDVLLAVNGVTVAGLRHDQVVAAITRAVAPRVLHFRAMRQRLHVNLESGVEVTLLNNAQGAADEPLVHVAIESAVLRVSGDYGDVSTHVALPPQPRLARGEGVRRRRRRSLALLRHVQRPARQSFMANASALLHVDVFNPSNATWEPLLEPPWNASARVAMIDAYDPRAEAALALAQGVGGAAALSPHLGRPVRHVLVTASRPELNVSAAFYSSLMAALASVQAAEELARQRKALGADAAAVLGRLGADTPGGTADMAGALRATMAAPMARQAGPSPPGHRAVTSELPASAFPYIFRNECGTPVAIFLSASGAASVAAYSAPSESQGEEAELSAAAAGAEDVSSEAAADAGPPLSALAEAHDGVVVAPGAERGFLLTSDRELALADRSRLRPRCASTCCCAARHTPCTASRWILPA
jgi:hypothetical protein